MASSWVPPPHSGIQKSWEWYPSGRRLITSYSYPQAFGHDSQRTTLDRSRHLVLSQPAKHGYVIDRIDEAEQLPSSRLGLALGDAAVSGMYGFLSKARLSTVPNQRSRSRRCVSLCAPPDCWPRQTFVMTKVCYLYLPRPQFTTLQKRIFPLYFGIETALAATTAATYPSGSILALASHHLDSALLGLTLAMSGLNLLVYGPKTIVAMVHRSHQGIVPSLGTILN